LVKFKKKSLSGSSKRWIQRHHNDDLVLKAKSLGFRSRAVFKLDEIDKKIKFLKKKDNILDLGASPGSWSQFLVKKGFKNILAVDILNMDPISEVIFIAGDFTEEKIQEKIKKKLGKIDTIISDIAVNTTGNKSLDSFKTNSITLDVLSFANQNLSNGSNVLCKFFNGELDKNIIDYAKNNFSKSKIIKPKASRQGSKEMYIYCCK
jgi:cell division protein FtsJ